MQLVRKAKHYFNAKKAWQEGFPQARSIEHACKAWEPYLQTWTQWIAQGKHLAPWSKWKRFYSQQPHYRLAWVMHEPFWRALAQYSSHHMFSWWPEITKEAAFQANTVALACIPTYYRQAYFRRVEDGTQSIHPRSARWAQDMGWLAPRYAHLNHWTLDSPLNTSPWRQGYACLDARQRGSFSMAQWCLGALECYALTDEQAVDAVGHCMRLCILHRWDKYSTEWQWFENTVRPAYRSRIDWDILAALHGVALPDNHPWQTWSSSLLCIAEHASNQGGFGQKTLRLLCTDTMLQLILDMAQPRSIKDIYNAIVRSNQRACMDLLDIPSDGLFQSD